jgi:hypothetical protein
MNGTMAAVEIMDAFNSNVGTVTAVGSILVALFTFLGAYMNSRALARKKARLKLVNMRLNQFYGPLYVASEATMIAYRGLLTKLGKPAVFEAGKEPTQDELEEWFLWMRTVFMPLNETLQELIIGNAHLIIEENMPDCLVEFVTHVVGYKAIMAKWEKGDFSERASLIRFPKGFDQYAIQSYSHLKQEQAKLLRSF